LLEIRRNRLATKVAFVAGSIRDFPYDKCGSSWPDMLFAKPLDLQAINFWTIEQSRQFSMQLAR
jgi:hypothetical protein